MNKKGEILVTALQYMKRYGYSGWSFRDIANDLGIKHTSIHYYFPSKDDLILQVLEDYIHDFFEKLSSGSLDDYFLLYEKVADSNQSCLCSILTNHLGLINDDMKKLLLIFKESNISYLSQALEDNGNKNKLGTANAIFTSLGGALSFGNIDPDNTLKHVVEYWKKELLENNS